MKNLRKGFTLVEIMIVVLIIGILMAIAVPNFMNARNTSQTKACVANLKTLETAKEQYLMDPVLTKAAATPTVDLLVSSKIVKAAPTCPTAGATYTLGAADPFDPICGSGIATHKLPM
jgi:type II secretion system protein G